jgi:hypothetical protein
MASPLARFLRAHAVSEDAPLNYTTMSGWQRDASGGSFHIPQTDRTGLFDAVWDTMRDKPDDPCLALAETTRFLDVFRLAFDIDLKPDDIPEISVFDLYHQVIEAVCTGMFQACVAYGGLLGDSEDAATARALELSERAFGREAILFSVNGVFPKKMHLQFPDAYVSTRLCFALADAIDPLLQEISPLLKVDRAVYLNDRTVLRMLGHSKGDPSLGIYSVLDPQAAFASVPLTRALIERASLVPPLEADRTPWELEATRIAREWDSLLPDNPALRKKSATTTRAMEPGSGGVVEAFVCGPVSDFLVARGKLKRALIVARGGIKQIVSKEGAKTIAVNIVNRDCVFKGGEHARNTPVLYIWITDQGVSLRCRDDGHPCKGSKVDIPTIMPTAIKALVKKDRKRKTPGEASGAGGSAGAAPKRPRIEEVSSGDEHVEPAGPSLLGQDVAVADRTARLDRTADWATDLLYGASNDAVVTLGRETTRTAHTEILPLEEPRHMRNCASEHRHRVGIVLDHRKGSMCIACIQRNERGDWSTVPGCRSRPTQPDQINIVLGTQITFVNNGTIQIFQPGSHVTLGANSEAENSLALNWLQGSDVVIFDDDAVLDAVFKKSLGLKDALVADLFAHVYRDKVAYAKDGAGKGRFYIWNGLWKASDESSVRGLFRGEEMERIIDSAKTQMRQRMPDDIKGLADELLQRLMDKWLTSKFLTGVIKWVETILARPVEEFLAKMDTNHTIVPFSDGTLWLTENNELRKSTPLDLCSIDGSTGYPYDEAKFNDPVKRQRVRDIFVKIFNDKPELFAYQMTQLCAALGGENYQRVIFFEGVGRFHSTALQHLI